MMDWDQHLLHLINREWTHPLLDWLMPAMSCIQAWLPLLVLAVLRVAWRGGRTGRQFLLCMIVAIGLGDGLVSHGLKHAVGRLRPKDVTTEVIVRDLGKAKPEFARLFQPPVQRPGRPRPAANGNSFPSSHTVNLFAAALVISHFRRGWGAFAFGFATLVGYSRIYVGAHWPSDIVPSIGLGLLIGVVSVWIVRRSLAWWARRSADRA